MIKLDKLAEPNILTMNKSAWTSELLSYLQRNEAIPKSLLNRYNQEDIKNALRKECNSKCMYCESTVSHVAYEHIEHIKPKAKDKFPELTYEWSNLGLACPVCNNKKGDKYDTDFPFINPYVDDPKNHFIAQGAFIYHVAGDKRAYLTESLLELNRPELIEKRVERINTIRNLIDLYTNEANQTIKESIKKEIEIEIARDKPYSLCAKSICQVLVQAN